MKEKIIGLFSEIADREEEIKSLREEIKESIESFCEEHDDYEKKAIKDAYKFFKNLSKDKTTAVDTEFQRDKIVDLLIGEK